ILYPDFSFHSWPEAECPEGDARGSHNWDRVVKDLLQEGVGEQGDAHAYQDEEDDGSEHHGEHADGTGYSSVEGLQSRPPDYQLEFEQKIPKLFWRGADTSPIRRQVVQNIHRIRGDLDRDFSGLGSQKIDVEWMKWNRAATQKNSAAVSDVELDAVRADSEAHRGTNNIFGIIGDGGSSGEEESNRFEDRLALSLHLLKDLFEHSEEADLSGGGQLELRKNVGGQSVPSGQCVRVSDWCGYQFLANIPGVSMPLSFKYRLFCNSVMLSSGPMLYQWFYSLVQPEKHYVYVDPFFNTLDAAMHSSDVSVYADIADEARFLAKTRLTTAAVDCYWRR
ncbi:unnamed protein product, partial [Amoebophrya sp. A25]